MDLIYTLVLIYLAYRGLTWYQRLRAQVGSGSPKAPDSRVKDRQGRNEDYIDYEELD
ncbi:MAG: hypothetical protein HC821_00650 [Lewinella sp.]|nr:hypothetical protein [Lewinella sp.]